MDSMSSNLKATLPLNVDEDPELLNLFKDSALSISSLFKHAQLSRRQTFASGYGTAITDIVDYVQAAVKDAERVPITIGGIISFLEQRQQALLKDLDRSSTTAKPSPVTRPTTTTKSPTPTDRQSPAASDTTAVKRRKSPPGPITVDKLPSPALSSLPLRACACDNPSWTQHAASTPSWPDVSLVQPAATIPVDALPLVVPALGSKRKREALLDVDLTNVARPHLNISRKRKSRSIIHHGYPLSTGPRYDDRMDTDDEGRERKRVARRV